MERSPEYRSPWNLAEALLLLVLFFGLGKLNYLFGDSLDFIYNYLPGNNSEVNHMLIGSIMQFILFVGYIYLIITKKYKMGMEVIGKTRIAPREIVRVGVFHSISLLFINTLLMNLMNLIHPVEYQHQDVANIVMKSTTTYEIVIVFFVTSILAPISEELYFRGFLYRAFKKHFNILFSIIFTSLIFAGLHFDLLRFIPLFVAAMWLNYIYEKYGNIYINIIAHAFWNAFMTTIIFLP